jgi:N-acetylglucosamine kinase-like BadF-type ATPase
MRTSGAALDHNTADDRAELFRVVAETAARGDTAASQLLARAALDIAAATRTLAHRMNIGQPPQRIALVLAGSAWQARGILVDTLRGSHSSRSTGC